MSIRSTLLQAGQTRDWPTVIAAVPYAEHLGIQYLSDQQCFFLPFRDDMIGNSFIRAMHGGVVASFMENAALIHSIVGEQQVRIPKPINIQIDYLRSASAQDCFARCETIRQGRRVANILVRCWQHDENKLVATARSHMLLENN